MHVNQKLVSKLRHGINMIAQIRKKKSNHGSTGNFFSCPRIRKKVFDSRAYVFLRIGDSHWCSLSSKFSYKADLNTKNSLGFNIL